MPPTSKEIRSQNMRAVKSKGSRIEKLLCGELWKKGFRYRKNVKSVYGKPDIVFKALKIAVFCDSEFWHGYDWEIKKNAIKSNRDFWIPKIERNRQRDIEVNLFLAEQGWDVLRFWGSQIQKDTDECVEMISNLIEKKKRKFIKNNI